MQEDPSVTLGTYSHVLGDSQREYAEKVAELLDYSGLKKRTSAVDSIMCVRICPLQNVPETWFTPPGWINPAWRCPCRGRNGPSWKNACGSYCGSRMARVWP